MEPRFSLMEQTPKIYRAMRELSEQIAGRIDPALNELVKIRASQLNGCASCLDMHTGEARAAGESEQRLHTLVAWRETPFFTDRERAALAFTEAVTTLGGGHVSDEVYAEVAEHFDQDELAALVWALVAITSRTVPGAAEHRAAGRVAHLGRRPARGAPR